MKDQKLEKLMSEMEAELKRTGKIRPVKVALYKRRAVKLRRLARQRT